jgi:sec-independent protein translocase protein TatC
MKATWRHALIAITLFAAVITPTPDILTLMMMSGPLYVLYAICVVLAYFMEKKDKAAYPEYYAELAKDEKALDEAVKDDWDNENYNPWFSEDQDDQDDEYQKPRATPSAPPPEIEKAANTVAMSDDIDVGEDQSSVMPDEDEVPAVEKTTEELAREDETRSGNPPPPVV